MLTDGILKSSSFNTTGKFVTIGLVYNIPSFPDLNWYYVCQLNGGFSGSNLKVTFALPLNITTGDLYISYNYHIAHTPKWMKFSATT